MSIKSLVQTTRPPFLILAPICVLLGLSLNWQNIAELPWFMPFLVFVGALLAHVSVNMFNEYFDFISGLDLKTVRTPFSGGSGALPADPDAVDATLVVAIITLFMTCLIGLYLMLERGPMILPVGVAGIVLVFFYTKWINKMPWVCLVSPGLGFGILMVMGTDFVMTGQYTTVALALSIVPFLLTNNLLLLNQYPDVEADASIGRRTFPIAYGIGRSNEIYVASAVAAYSMIGVLVWLNIIPQLALIALLPAGLSVIAGYGAIKYGLLLGEHRPFMAANVGAAILTPLLLAIAVILG